VITYLDSSTILRIVLGQANALKEWRSITQGVASALVEVECLRTLDRLRLAEGLNDAEIAARRETVFRLLEAIEVVELTRPILSRAAQPLPTALGTLDAIHLATALLWKERTKADLVMATHDEGLATASRASGLRVIGVSASV
jgi:predicted nucleic acid-binding protein